MNSLTIKSNRNVYIDIMINYTLAITNWKQFYEVGAIFTVVQLFWQGLKIKFREVQYQEIIEKKTDYEKKDYIMNNELKIIF